MRQLSTRVWLIGCIALVLATSGCFQSAGSGDEPTPQSQFPTATPEPPTATPSPTATETVEAQEVPPSPTQDVAPPVQQPTQDSGIFTTTEPTPDTAFPQDVPTQETVPQQPISEQFQTATAIVAQATNQFLTPTQDPFQTQVTVPTFTPTTDPFAIPTATTAAIPGVDCVHEVRSGENLFRLSLQYGVTVNQIAAASGITNIDLLSIGQRLTIPGCGTTGAVPPATSAPTQSGGIGATPGTGGPVNPTPIPSAGGVTHIVQQGETLFEISLQYGVPVNTIAAANGISNINLIYINQELTIP